MPERLGEPLETPLFERVAIIGIGLIGSSIAHAMRHRRMAGAIVAIDRDPEVAARVDALGLADAVFTDVAEGVKDCDLVVLCVPVGVCGPVAKQMATSLREGAIVTDVGSVKGAVVAAMEPHLPAHVHFIPGHPVAGTEQSGPDAGFATLFHDRWCILTPAYGVDPQAVARLQGFWEAMGARIEFMSAPHHDLVLAITSHVPHLIAYNIVGTAADLEQVTQSEVIKFSAGGFRDFTRIAASDPTMWRDVFLNNKEAVLEMISRFNEDLAALARAIRWDDGDALYDLFSRTRSIRRSIIDLGQETDAPDFGRRPGKE
ncbi:MAG: prephenate/arogenate dehydrogenase family protein [Salinarimonas sp.]|nr:prephenate/arogenate dehydrogenase family protein [Salinarimonas sp.]